MEKKIYLHLQIYLFCSSISINPESIVVPTKALQGEDKY